MIKRKLNLSGAISFSSQARWGAMNAVALAGVFRYISITIICRCRADFYECDQHTVLMGWNSSQQPRLRHAYNQLIGCKWLAKASRADQPKVDLGP